MHPSPVLVLVDPRTQRRAAIRDRLLAIAVGAVAVAVSAVPLLAGVGS